MPFSLLALIPLATAQQGSWQQCGGIGWTGGTTCIAGWTCTRLNDYYFQCLQGASSSSSSSAGTPTSTSSSALPSATSSAGLHTVAVSKGKLYFGSATDNPELNDATYKALLSDTTQFGQITPGNSMKWDATEPSRGVFTFTNGDVIANLAATNGQILRGHNCVWHSQLPNWVTAGNFNASTLTSIIQTHCSTVVNHYKGKIYSWDVVNEPFNDDGTFRTSVFYNTLGTSYIPTALQAARAADPNAKLYINDYNIDGLGAKSTGMANLISQLKANNTPIDGVGIQAHLIVGAVPSSFQANLEQFAALGVEVAITELDIRMTLPVTPDKLAQQKADYQHIVAACNAVPACVGITIWDYTDKYSWIPSVFSGQGAALPWDENLVKKPAFDGIVQGFGV